VLATRLVALSMSLPIFYDTLIEGIAIGCIFALVAVSINIMYRPSQAFNFGQGEFVLLGGVLSLLFLNSWHWPWLAALPVLLLIGAALGGLTELVAIRPVISRSATSSSWVITTLAVSLILDDVIGARFNGVTAVVPLPPLLSTMPMQIGSALVSTYQIALLVLTILIVIAVWYAYRTRHGLAIMALSEDREAALLRGVPAGRLNLISWMAGGALAALAGVLAAPITQVSSGLGFQLLIDGFIAAAIGGIGDNRGALAGGLVVGLAQSFAAVLFGPLYQELASFVVFLVILGIRPRGILGEVRIREV
jgi:branched-chain amino acid transport system permease protein